MATSNPSPGGTMTRAQMLDRMVGFVREVASIYTVASDQIAVLAAVQEAKRLIAAYDEANDTPPL